jgi:methanogenic corrinoid protein MtbC1
MILGAVVADLAKDGEPRSGGVEGGAPRLGQELYVPAHPVRFVTATALFDGHDVAINIMRRILQAQGAEVVHLGHASCRTTSRTSSRRARRRAMTW